LWHNQARFSIVLLFRFWSMWWAANTLLSAVWQRVHACTTELFSRTMR